MKIIIVDDEYLFRKALQATVDFESLDFQIVGEAKNGEEAIDLVNRHSPEIALVDINMPKVDGLEFAQYLRDREIGTRVIFISGYDHFDYAKEAMRLGAHSYLLKPVDDDELIREIKELKSEIEIDRSRTEELSSLKAQVDKNKPFMRERHIQDILMGLYDGLNKPLEKKLRYLDIGLPYDQFIVIVSEIAFSDSMDEELMEAHRIEILNLFDKLLRDVYRFEWAYDHKRRLSIILEVDGHYSEERFVTKLEIISKSANRGIRTYYGISNKYESFGLISTAYKEALAAVGYGINQKKSSSFYSTVFNKGLGALMINKELRNELLISMRICDAKAVEEALDKIFKKMVSSRSGINQLRYVYMELSLICIEIISEYEEDTKDFDIWLEQLYDEKNYKQTIVELGIWMKSVFAELIHQIEKIRKNNSSALVRKARNYINENYQRFDFSIDMIANDLYVNYSHLCYTFKKETQITINEYLVQIRMKKAVDLIEQGETVVWYIADKVGFSDSGYFSKSFKKHMGVTPSQYINSRS